MEIINVYSKFLLDKFNSKTITEKFMKPNKNSHFTSSKLYYYFEKDNLSPSKLIDTINANLSLLKGDLLDDLKTTQNLYEINDDGSFLINNEKDISSLTLDKLKSVYKKKYEEFENDDVEKSFTDNFFSHYETSLRNALQEQNKDIVKIYNESLKIDEKMANLSYNEYKRSGVDYFEITKKYFSKLKENLEEQVNCSLRLKKFKDQQTMENIFIESMQDIKRVVENKTNKIFLKSFETLKNNKKIAEYEKDNLKRVEDYLDYLSFAYFSKDYTNKNFFLLQKILQEQYKGDWGLILSLLNKYGYVSKQRALTLCEEIGNLRSFSYSTHFKRRMDEPLKDRIGFLLADLTVKLKYKSLLKAEIESGDLRSFVRHLKEYDSYAIANYDYDSVVMLNLYALTELLNEKIYDDYLRSTQGLE